MVEKIRPIQIKGLFVKLNDQKCLLCLHLLYNMSKADIDERKKRSSRMKLEMENQPDYEKSILLTVH